MRQIKKIKFVATIFGICLIVMFCGLIYQMARIQIIDYERYDNLASSQHFQKVELSSRRGPILDRNGVKLAESLRVTSVFADPLVISNKVTTSEKLAELLNQDVGSIYKLLNKEKRFVWIKRKLTDIENIGINRLKLNGIYTKYEYERLYPNNELLSHIIGITDIDGNGIDGVELVFNDVLKGEKGYLIVGMDGLQRQIVNINSGGKQPNDGAGIMLTIDSVIQRHVEDEIEDAFQKRKPLSITAVVLDTSTGEILAMANRPTFNPNKFSDYPADSRRNRAITDCYEPGSIMKPIIVGALFNHNLAKPGDEIFCHNGAYQMGSRVLHDTHDYGLLTVSDIVVKSSNIGMAQLAARISNERLYNYLKDIRFGEKLDVMLPGETGGILRPLSSWTRYSAPSIAMGHEIAITPLQFVNAFSSIANGGNLLQPMIVKAITANNGTIILKKIKTPKVIKRIMSHATARDMLNPILVKVVNEGTGKSAKLEEYQVAGKTGTSQKLDGSGYSHTKFIGSFVAYAPAEQPKICVLVMVDEPKGGQYYGGTVAAPIVKNIIKKTLDYQIGKHPYAQEKMISLLKQ